MTRIYISARHPNRHLVTDEREKPSGEVVDWVLEVLHSTFEMRRRIGPMGGDQ